MTTTNAFASTEDVIGFLVDRGLVELPDLIGIVRLSGGVSGDTFLVRRAAGVDWVVKQALRTLRVESHWASDPRRIHREAAALRWLNGVLGIDATVRIIHEDFERHAIVMEAVPQPHSSWKELLLAGEIRDEHIDRFAAMLAAMHVAGWEQSEDLPRTLGDGEYFEGLRLEPYYRYTGRRIPECREFLEALADATAARRDGFVHGDYSPKNILVQPRAVARDRLVVLDHEVSHVGDPAFDLGFSFAHFVGKANLHPELATRFRDAALRYWRAYAVGTEGFRDEGFEQRAVAHTLACVLARASGRSPLEYLDGPARDRQRCVAVRLINAPPVDIPSAISSCVEELHP